jgi:hypothetical protein
MTRKAAFLIRKARDNRLQRGETARTKRAARPARSVPHRVRSVSTSGSVQSGLAVTPITGQKVSGSSEAFFVFWKRDRYMLGCFWAPMHVTHVTIL